MNMTEVAQACFQGLDTYQSYSLRAKEELWRHEDLRYRDEEKLWRREDRSWREEDRSWRQEDREWRGEDVDWRFQERTYATTWREEDRLWRRQDVEQRCLDNARWVWSRFVEKNRRDVEEKSEQLKTVSNLAALIAGFAVVALVELQFAPDQPEWIVMAYACSTSVTVGLMMNSMVLCSMMLSTVLKVGQNFVCEEEETKFLYNCRNFVLNYDRGNLSRNTPPAPTRTFAQTWDNQYDDHWRFAYSLFQCGVPCFMLALVFASWLKFNYSITTGVIVSTIMFASFILFLWIQQMWVWELFVKSKPSEDPITKKRHGLPFDWHAIATPGQRRSYFQVEQEDGARSRSSTVTSESSNSSFRLSTGQGSVEVARSNINGATEEQQQQQQQQQQPPQPPQQQQQAVQENPRSEMTRQLSQQGDPVETPRDGSASSMPHTGTRGNLHAELAV